MYDLKTSNHLNHSALIQGLRLSKTQIEKYWETVRGGNISLKEIAKSFASAQSDPKLLEQIGLNKYACAISHMTCSDGDWEDDTYDVEIVASSTEEADEKVNERAYSRYGSHCTGASVLGLSKDVYSPDDMGKWFKKFADWNFKEALLRLDSDKQEEILQLIGVNVREHSAWNVTSGSYHYLATDFCEGEEFGNLVHLIDHIGDDLNQYIKDAGLSICDNEELENLGITMHKVSAQAKFYDDENVTINYFGTAENIAQRMSKDFDGKIDDVVISKTTGLTKEDLQRSLAEIVEQKTSLFGENQNESESLLFGYAEEKTDEEPSSFRVTR